MLAICVPAFVGARGWRRRIAPEWETSLAMLADLVGAISGVIVLSELLGTVGQFRRVPLTVASLVLGLGSAWWCARTLSEAHLAIGLGDDRGRGAGRSARRSASDVIVASASSALVASQWSTWVARSVSVGIGNAGGPGNGDSLWYHMPFAAAFVQSGWTTRLQYLNGEALVTYYPANTSVLHAVGILTMGSDVLSVFVNLALVPIALLAGWCIGERAGIGPASLAGVAVALTIPVVVVSEAATAKDDMLGIVGLLACIAFVVHSVGATSDRGTAIYGGLAAGLAVGSKLTLVAPVVALGLGLAILTPARSKLSTMARWTGATFATGGYWYLRNLLRVGNPLPGLDIGLGRFRLPHPATPSMDNFGTDLLGNVANSRVVRDALLPGLKIGFGVAWPVIMIVAVGATVAGVATLRGRDLVAPVVGVAALLAFFVTPGTVWAPQLIARPGVRFVSANLFAFNLRYMLPSVAVGLVIVPLVARRWHRGSRIATAALGLALAATQLAPQSRQSWSRHHVPIAVTVGVLAAFGMAALTSGRFSPHVPARRARRVAVAGVVLVVVVAGWAVPRTYSHRRYEHLALARWARTLSGARIGFSGFVFSYPLYGAHLQNRVQMIGERGPDGAWHPARTCLAWRRDVRRAGVKYVVVPVGPPAVGLGIDLSRWRVGLPGGEPPDEPPESRWTRRDPGARVVFSSSQGVAAYVVSGPATTKGCS